MTPDILDDKQDDRIRAALRQADATGQLGVVAAVTGIAGGERELRKIMNSRDAIPVLSRGILAIHINHR